MKERVTVTVLKEAIAKREKMLAKLKATTDENLFGQLLSLRSKAIEAIQGSTDWEKNSRIAADAKVKMDVLQREIKRRDGDWYSAMIQRQVDLEMDISRLHSDLWVVSRH